MELMQLEMFVAMVEEGNFHRAAERVSRTQPALSMALRKLEEEIGASLFDRSNRAAYALTDAGQLLYERAKRMLELRDETALALEKLRTLQSGNIRIGANESACLYLLPPLIRAFHRLHPNIEVEIFRHPSHDLIAELRQRRIDFGILAFKPDDDDLEAIPVMRDEMTLIASPEHPIAERQCVHVRELGTHRFVALNLRDAFARRTTEAFKKHGAALNVMMKVDTFEEMKKLVAMNLAIALAPLMCVRDELNRGELATVRVEGLKYERTLWLARRSTESHSFAARAFAQLVEQVARETDQRSDSRDDSPGSALRDARRDAPKKAAEGQTRSGRVVRFNPRRVGPVA
jgi:DNA-binding transcriptional LysR family regulator